MHTTGQRVPAKVAASKLTWESALPIFCIMNGASGEFKPYLKTDIVIRIRR